VLDRRPAKLRRLKRSAVPAWRWPRLARVRLCAGRRLPILGPSGHVGVGAPQAPEPAAQLEVANKPAQPRAAHEAAILPAIQH